MTKLSRLSILATTALTLMTTAALAGNSQPPVQVSEPGLLGLFAGGVILAVAAARRYRK